MDSRLQVKNFIKSERELKIPKIYYEELDHRGEFYPTEIDVQNMIISLNNAAGVKKAAFELNGLMFKPELETIDINQYFSIIWTGYEFKLELSTRKFNISSRENCNDHEMFHINKTDNYCYPILSEAALEDFFGSLNRTENTVVTVNDSRIDIFRKMATGQIHRLPKGFWKEIDEDFQKTFIEYFLRFCCGFNERTVIDLKITHLKRWKLMPFMSGSSGRKFSLYEMVSMVYPEIKPWEMIYVSRGTYANSDNVMNTLRYIMDIYALESPEDLKFSHIMKIAPGVISYIKNAGGIDEVRKLLANTNTK